MNTEQLDRKLQRAILDLEELAEERMDEDSSEELRDTIKRLKRLNVYSTEV